MLTGLIFLFIAYSGPLISCNQLIGLQYIYTSILLHLLFMASHSLNLNTPFLVCTPSGWHFFLFTKKPEAIRKGPPRSLLFTLPVYVLTYSAFLPRVTHATPRLLSQLKSDFQTSSHFFPSSSWAKPRECTPHFLLVYSLLDFSY